MRSDLGTMALSADPFQTRLLPGERILWRGRPERGLFLSSLDYFSIAYSILFTVLGVKMLSNGRYDPQEMPVIVTFGIVFFVLGLVPVVGRILIDPWLRRRLRYAVTDKRILIERASPFRRFASLSLSGMPAIHQSGDIRIGNLRFGQPVAFWQRRFMYLSNTLPSLDRVPQFLSIAQPDQVLALITGASELRRQG